MPAAKPKPARRPPAAAAEDRGPVSAPFIWAEPRNLFFFRTGRLIGGDCEETCEIVALTESGALVRAASLYRRADPCTLELNSAHLLTGIVAWCDDGTIGLEFSDRNMVREVLSRREASFPYRAPRLGLKCALELRLGSKRLSTRSHDISERGIKVDLPPGAEGATAVVALGDLGAVQGRVRWCREGKAGIAFERPIPIERFTRWVTARLAAQAG